MSIWIPIGNCTHCGRAIEGTIDTHITSVVIAGCEPMIYRHIQDKSTDCIITKHYKCEPYTNWGKQNEYLIKLKKGDYNENSSEQG